MIAAAGTVKLQAGEHAGWDLNADVMLRLQNIEVEDAELRKHVQVSIVIAASREAGRVLNRARTENHEALGESQC